MASGFFSILDDLAALMDDVAHTSQVATAKTAGVLGDDLAVNAEKATGFLSEQELPVLWAITKGSFVNKIIIIPIALLLSATYPMAIKVALVLGAIYLAYEGAEKIVHYLFHRTAKAQAATEHPIAPKVDSYKSKIRSAITTDFILSIEIVIIALGTTLDRSLPVQVMVVTLVSFLATVGVYGLVALIVRMDDVGYKLVVHSQGKGFLHTIGRILIRSLPLVIKALGFIGTIALLLVAGGILVHNIEFLHSLLPALPSFVKDFVAGLLAGLIVVLVFTGSKKLYSLVKFRIQNGR